MSDPLRNFQPAYCAGDHAFMTMRAGAQELVTVLAYDGGSSCGICTPHYHVQRSSDPAILCVTSGFLVPCPHCMATHLPESLPEPSPYRHARREVA